MRGGYDFATRCLCDPLTLDGVDEVADASPMGKPVLAVLADLAGALRGLHSRCPKLIEQFIHS